MLPALARRARLGARFWLGNYPRVFLPLVRFKRGTDAVGPGTELVIEGFPRSGNTFAVAAFEFAQPRPVQIAHHLHVPAQIQAATRRRLPVILLLREPEDAVVSYLVMEPDIPPRQALRHYLRFYSTCLPLVDRMVVAGFDQVVSDYGEVLRRTNQRFGCSFQEFVHTDANVASVMRSIEEHTRTLKDSGVTRGERRMARPSDERERLKHAVRQKLQKPEVAPLLAAAEDLFHQLATQADQ